MKSYDQAYYDRWYRHPRHRVSKEPDRERKVHLAVSVAEYVMRRSIRSVLDIGCGEGLWYLVLRRLRPGIRYIGVDPSGYAVKRYGVSRHIRLGSFGTFDRLRLPSTFDLVVCADALQYVNDRDAAFGLRAIRDKLHGGRGGVAYIEAYTTEDGMIGDREEWTERSAADYRRLFRRAGLTLCGPQCYTDLDYVRAPLSFDHA
jgi:SAM-dependent methyltransferase